MTEPTNTPVATKPQMPEQNGIRRPQSHTLCGQAWAVMDKLSAEKQGPVAINDLLIETNKAGLHPGNVKAEYARWRKFHGVTGRVVSQAKAEAEAAKLAEKEAKKAEAQAAKAAKAAEKEAKKAEREAAKAAKEQEKAQKAAEREAAKQAKAQETADKKAAAEEAKARKAAEAEAAKQAKAAEQAQGAAQ